MSDKPKVWERTSVQYLLRNRQSGRYYGRWKISGKQKWVSLDTDVFGVAKLRLRDEAAKIDGMRSRRATLDAGDCTMAELMALHGERIKSNPDLKPASIQARLVGLKKIQKTWPRIDELKPASITPAAVLEWANRFKAEGTAFTPPGSNTTIKGNSAGSVNRAIDTLRRVLDIAVERGANCASSATVKLESEAELDGGDTIEAHGKR
jgi:hypothetical protein